MKKGFTLIELLVVIVIIGILASIGLGSFQSSQVKARDAKRKGELGQIARALEVYFNDKGAYPLSDVNGAILGCANASACVGAASWEDENNTLYMVELPQDPRAPTNIYNYVSSDGRSYQLYARLENNRDRDVHKDASNNPQVFSGVNCGDLECNYGIASTNTSAVEGRTLIVE